MDLDELYSEGRHVALLEYIDMLPSACRLNEAILNDPERAREIAKLPKPKEPWSPRISEYDLAAVMRREFISAINSVQQTVVASVGGKPKPVKPFPVPRTELDRAREAEDKQFTLDIIGMFGFSETDL